MKLVFADRENRIKDFLNFYKRQNLNNPLKRDSLSGLLKNLLYGKSELCRSVDLQPMMVTENNKVIMISLVAHAHRMPEYVQLGFFESEQYNPEAFSMLLEFAEAFAISHGANKLTGSLNVHVNYGLGFLSSDFNKMQSFGMAHNPSFYNEYFEKNGFRTIEMVSYKKDISQTPELMNSNMRKKLGEKYSVREVNLRDLKSEIGIYTDINNRSFGNHLFYYPRKNEEDLELFKDMKFLMNTENLLFVEKEGVPVGFMLWYPDFNQIMSIGETVGLKTVIKNRIFSNKIKTFKIVEMGVVPEERSKGAILALFDYCFQCVKGKYDSMESGWILSDNLKSKNFGIKWADGESKQYKAFIKDIT